MLVYNKCSRNWDIRFPGTHLFISWPVRKFCPGSVLGCVRGKQQDIFATMEEHLTSGCNSASLSNIDTSGKVRRWKLGGGVHQEERLEVSFPREKNQNQIRVIIMTYHYFLTCNLPRQRRWGANIQKQMWPSLNICYYCSMVWLPNEKESHFYALISLGPYGVV